MERTSNRRITRSGPSFCAVAVLGIACCSGSPSPQSDDVTVNEEIYLRGPGDALQRQAGTCAGEVLGGSGGEFLRTTVGELTVVESATSHGIVVAVSTEAGPAAARFYDEQMLRSGEAGDFSLKTASGKEYVIRVWGSSDRGCQASD
jgi:hypothetical protein